MNITYLKKPEDLRLIFEKESSFSSWSKFKVDEDQNSSTSNQPEGNNKIVEWDVN